MPDARRDDELWLAELKDALHEAVHVPRSVLEAGYSAYAWRTIDAELAELTYDSSTEDPALTGARGQEAPLRSLTFATQALTVELQVEPPVLLGQLVPPQLGQVVLVLQDGSTRSTPVDALGCFTVDPVPDRPFRLRVDAEHQVSTGWITL